MRRSNGESIRLGEELGRGGEGTVYALAEDPTLVAKVYARALDSNHQEKLTHQKALANDQLRATCAWPLDTLRDGSGRVVGFLMDRVQEHEDIHTVYGPRSRIQSFPQADYRFLVHTAANLARAFSAVHESGHVIGDVNDKFALVSKKAIVRLVDCDSFQIRANGKLFYCRVGIPTYQPPEFHSLKSYDGIVRTANHDNFGLAVLAFQLLFLARHPFAGRPLVAGELPIERAIREFRFPYGPDAATRGIAAPPHTLVLASFTPEVASLFQRAFSPEGTKGKRPTAAEWVGGLLSLEKQLKGCTTNPQHQYVASLGVCPLCTIEAGAGTLLFIGHLPPVTGLSGAEAARQVPALWQAIEAIRRPSLLPPPRPEDFRLNGRPLGSDGRDWQRALAIFVGIGAAFLLLAIPGAFLGTIILGVVAYNLWPSGANPEVMRRRAQRAAAADEYKRSLEHYQRECGDAAFVDTHRQLKSAKTKLDRFEQHRQEQRLNADRHAWLEARLVRRASIKGIGPALTSTLESFGIETAADIPSHGVQGVPGIGPARSAELVAWKKRCEHEFQRRYNPSRPPDPAARKRIDAKLARDEQELLRLLREGPQKLQFIVRRGANQQQKLEPSLREAAKKLAQAIADDPGGR